MIEKAAEQLTAEDHEPTRSWGRSTDGAFGPKRKGACMKATGTSSQ